MTVTVTVPDSALSDAAVHRALARLISAIAAQQSRARDLPPTSVQVEDAETRYARFLSALPERSREFLRLVRSKGELGIAEAMTELDVKVGKAMGGITGSIARWAPEYNITVPFEAVRSLNGQRAWRWIGLDRVPAPPIPVRRRPR